MNKNFDDLSMTDVENLIVDGATEKQNLEFKKEIWGRADRDVREMLRDITSMANAFGGYIVVGLDEYSDTGVAKEIFNIEDAETEQDRIISCCLSNTDQRLTGIKIKKLSSGDNNILLLKIPNSYSKPHMITFKGLNQFWYRHDKQKSKMSTNEIEESIGNKLSSLTKKDDFIKKRIADWEKVTASTGEARLIIGASPLNVKGEIIDLNSENTRDILKSPRGERSGGWNLNFNNRGIPTPTINGLKISLDNVMSLEIFRTGYLEANNLLSRIVGGGEDVTNAKLIHNFAMVELIHSFFKGFSNQMEECGYDGQYIAYLSFYNFFEYKLDEYNMFNSAFNETGIWNENELLIGPIVFNEINHQLDTKLICDRVWNAFGFENEPYFKSGELVIPK